MIASTPFKIHNENDTAVPPSIFKSKSMLQQKSNIETKTPKKFDNDNSMIMSSAK